jgi:hypothetical protein
MLSQVYSYPNKGAGRTATGACAVAEPSLPRRIFRDGAGRAGERCGRETRGRPNGLDVKLRGQALVAAAERHAACPHLRRAMQAA